MPPDIVVLAGGRGTRMGPLAQRYGCKSLIPVNGTTALEWLLRTLTFAFLGEARIFLCIERAELQADIKIIVQSVGGKGIEIFFRPQLKGTMHALYLLQDTLQGERVFVLYGHQPVPPKHIINMLRRKSTGAIATLYSTSSNISSKINVVNKKGKITDLLKSGEEAGLEENEYYIDVPYLLPMGFAQVQPNTYVKSHDAILRWLRAGNPVRGEIAHFPHEFHYPYELPSIEQFLQGLEKELQPQKAY